MCIGNQNNWLEHADGSENIHKEYVQKDVYKRKCLRLVVTKWKNQSQLSKNVNGWAHIKQLCVQSDVYKPNWLAMDAMEHGDIHLKQQVMNLKDAIG